MTPQKTTQLNIALILLSGVLAIFLPFELFLFAYAVLGPLHYLTEIHWLHQRNYFMKRRWDVAPIVLIALLLLSGLLGVIATTLQFDPTLFIVTIVIATFCWAGIAMVTDKPRMRVALLLCAVVAAAGVAALPYSAVLFGIFLPTIIHVFVFTGLFMLSGAMKRNNQLEYLQVIVFLGVAAVLLLLPSTVAELSDYVFSAYDAFVPMHTALMKLLGGSVPAEGVFTSAFAVAVMRFVAFAYTYHYLNWFSKTSIIKWHTVRRPVLVAMIVMWLGSIAIYLYDYTIGLRVLLLLSFLHVYLEFPLNWRSFGDIAQGVRKWWNPESPTPPTS